MTQLHPVAGRVLVLGADGMLGRAWCELLESLDLEYGIATRPALDLCDSDTIERAVSPAFDTVVNCAAWTDVDGAESDEATASWVNGQAVGQLADRCRSIGAVLVHYSTDYVFDGHSRTSPWPTDAPIDPINAYGRSKAAGEQALMESGCAYLLVRTSWLYAPWGRSFVSTIARLARERPRLRIVDDQRGRPSEARHVAQTTSRLLEREARGTFHVTDGGECSWYELAREIVHNLGLDCSVDPCDSTEFQRPAKRPAFSTLDLTATERLLGPMPRWQDNLAATLAAAHDLDS